MRRKAACIDCGGVCDARCYRCRPCANREIWVFQGASGRARNITPGSRASQVERARARAERTERIRDDLTLGIPPGRIAADLGITEEAIWRQMRRHGHYDIARHFRASNKRTAA